MGEKEKQRKEKKGKSMGKFCISECDGGGGGLDPTTLLVAVVLALLVMSICMPPPRRTFAVYRCR